MIEDIEAWQQFLYPLGLLSTALFGLRFFTQWWHSEKAGRSVVTPSFWYISMAGNLSLALHGALQLQLPIALVQGLQAILARRNLDFSLPQRPKFARLLLPAFLILAVNIGIFVWISLGKGEWVWMRVPATPWSKGTMEIPLFLQILGITGIFLFSSRFYLQWWEAEKSGTSHLSARFWSVSLTGAILSSLYFFYSLDFINLLGPFFGSVGAARNLFLARRR